MKYTDTFPLLIGGNSPSKQKDYCDKIQRVVRLIRIQYRKERWMRLDKPCLMAIIKRYCERYDVPFSKLDNLIFNDRWAFPQLWLRDGQDNHG